MTLLWIFVIIFCFSFLLPDDKKETNVKSFSETIFTSKFTRGGNLFYSERLIFDKYNVTLKSNDGVNSLYTTTRTQTIPIKKITGYKISRYLVGCNITIIGDGFQNILAIGYTGEDSDKIESKLKSLIN